MIPSHAFISVLFPVPSYLWLYDSRVGSTNELAGPLPAIMQLFYLCCSFTPKAGTQKCVSATQNYSFYLL